MDAAARERPVVAAVAAEAEKAAAAAVASNALPPCRKLRPIHLNMTTPSSAPIHASASTTTAHGRTCQLSTRPPFT